MLWDKKRIKNASLGMRPNSYEAMPTKRADQCMKARYPNLYKFDAISIGDRAGTLFLVPLDESSTENAEYILRAIAAYQGE